MRRAAIAVFLVMLWFPWRYAYAAPYLTCDCTPAEDKVTGFQLTFGSQPSIDVPAESTCRGTACAVDRKLICYDLGTLPNGPFTVTAKAVNVWGQSNDSVPLSDVKQLPTSPSSLKIVK